MFSGRPSVVSTEHPRASKNCVCRPTPAPTSRTRFPARVQPQGSQVSLTGLVDQQGIPAQEDLEHVQIIMHGFHLDLKQRLVGGDFGQAKPMTWSTQSSKLARVPAMTIAASNSVSSPPAPLPASVLCAVPVLFPMAAPWTDRKSLFGCRRRTPTESTLSERFHCRMVLKRGAQVKFGG